MEAATRADLPSETGPAKRLSPEARERLRLRKQQLGEVFDEASKPLRGQ
jgi:hypothetical protein